MVDWCWEMPRKATLAAVLLVVAPGAAAIAAPWTQLKDVSAVGQAAVSLENEYLRFVIGADARSLRFIDRRTGTDYYDRARGSSLAYVKIGQDQYDASTVCADGGGIKMGFGDSGVTAVLKPTVHKHYIVFEVVSVDGKGVGEFTFVDVPLRLETEPHETFVACALALNLKTRVDPIPQPMTHLKATCYLRFGLTGARVAFIGCPQGELRAVLKEVVTAAPALPKSDIGGPWALDAEINRGSYLFNFGGLSEETVDDWIKLAQDLGINQIDFHGGSSFRFGDCRPDPETYPNGFASLKRVVDRLHAAGIAAGLHTYAFFIAKDCPWVTPVPDPRLAKDAVFTLAEPVASDTTTVPVVETTKDMSATTGFFVRNSLTLQIDDELITYSGISKEPPYAFTGCKRGAHGTRAAPHDGGARVQHLKQCFFLFAPDGDSTLLTEVAARTAEAYNKCGFDLMYLDALDGEDILGGSENGWHYGSKFVFEVCKRLNKPAVMEMSTFHHHLWCVRSRMGAWDHPIRSHKKFIDIHCQANQAVRRMFLPGHLGWWAVKTWSGIQEEPTFADDIEYLCGKCIGNDVGFSVMGVNPENVKTTPVYQRLGSIMKRYETLRHVGCFDESVKSKLAEPEKEFALFQDSDGRWRFQRVRYAKHKVERIDDSGDVWSEENPFGKQPLRLRIEALMSAGPYDAADNITLADFTDPRDFADRQSAPGVTVKLQPAPERVNAEPGPLKVGQCAGAFIASKAGRTDRKGAWAKAGKTFSPPLNLDQHQALGFWVLGDGRREVLNLQLASPRHITSGIGEHYVIVDFTGWRYFELIEPEGERYSHYAWPYGSPYSIYRQRVDYGHVERLNLWYNDLPPNQRSTCYLSPIRALPLVPAKLKDPAVTIDDRTILFPVEMEPGSYLEFNSPSDCKLYGPRGELIGEIPPRGDVPVLRTGANLATFTCDAPTDVRPRARVTVICQGERI